jgi:pentatricopeptide repeat protein
MKRFWASLATCSAEACPRAEQGSKTDTQLTRSSNSPKKQNLLKGKRPLEQNQPR